MFFVLFCGLTWDASTVSLHLLCGCAFQIYSVGAVFFFFIAVVQVRVRVQFFWIFMVRV